MRCLAVCCSLLFLVACGQARHLVPREHEPVAWMVEDLSHGTDRQVDALIAPEASQGQLAVAGWLRARVHNLDVVAYPAQIEARRQRWALLRGGLARGSVLAHPSGKLRLRDDLPADEREVFARPVAEENRDRDSCDGILVSISRLDPFSRRAVEFLATLRAVRHRLDSAVTAATVEASATPLVPTP